MEQRRGPTSQPLEGAGFDPAFIPGLTTPAPGEPEDAKPEPAERAEAEDATDTSKATVTEPASDVSDVSDASDEEDGAPDGGPVFEAADRRARIVADHRGVRLSLDDQSCEFRWDEVGAVETETGRFGKRFTVTVHTPDRRWYPIEIEATSRSRFPEWEAALDEVLDRYFDDGTDDAEASDEADEAGEANESEGDGDSPGTRG